MPLPWDSQHFEISVGQIISPALTNSELENILSFAKEQGYHLIYWATCPDRMIPLPLLQSFSGSLVDRKVTYQRKLSTEFTFGEIKNPSHSFEVIEFPRSQANQQLKTLALIAGGHSRFHDDPCISKEKFAGMYHIWINRSTLHEIADVVFIVKNSANMEDCLGMVTGSVKNGIGKVGLMGVQKKVQGQGIGSLLMKTLHEWLISNGIHTSEVVTQKNNIRACKFYERFGYKLESLQHYYHFWVQL
ncbi:MAG TPA: GNAT family N-acetyltransferase [Nitrospirales bacterium]|nr:GNAT family N-acetyltransferase [Nitrospirales bacterium]